jgi:hypothetical protein
MTAAKGQVVVRIPVRRGVEVSSLLAGIAGAFAQALGGSLTAQASTLLNITQKHPHSSLRSPPGLLDHPATSSVC